jgi:hypothetical protein
MPFTTSKAGIIALGLSLVLLAGCAGGGATADSPEARAEIAGELARLSLEVGSLDSALDSGADWAWDASAETLEIEVGRALTEEEQAKVRDVLRDVLTEFLTPALWEETITRVYSERFTADELDSILAFYGSPAGRKVLETEQAVRQAVNLELEGPLEERLEEFIGRVDEELAKAFPDLATGEGS